MSTSTGQTPEQVRKTHQDILATIVLHNRGIRQPIRVAIIDEFRIRPIFASVIFSAVLAGAGAVVLGAGASRAFTVIGGEGADQYIARGMGVAMTLGAIMAIVGIVRAGLLIEMLGLGIMSAGMLLYTFVLFSGLGFNGWVAGILSAGIGFGTALRVTLVARAAKQLYVPVD